MSDEEQDCPPLLNTSDKGATNEDDDSDGWDEMEVSGEQTTCLFCPLQFHTIAVALDHCRSDHNFNLQSLKDKYNMDCYSYIKMINYIRLQKPHPKILTESSVALWDDEAYLKPGDMETWLMYDFDDLGSAPSTPHYAIDGKTPISNLSFSDLQRQIEELTKQLKHRDMLLEICHKDMEQMREVTRTIVDSGDALIKKMPHNVISSGCDSSDYFNSYSHFGIHHDMLNDSVRTECYRDAILNNSKMFAGKVVLDVGCGTGILSMFSAKAGAEKVIGVDQSEVIYKAMDIIRENNLQDKIHLLKGQLERVELPEDKVDIIISEWMGYFLLFEGMLDSVIHARDTFLKSDGLILPNRCNISIVGVSDIGIELLSICEYPILNLFQEVTDGNEVTVSCEKDILFSRLRNYIKRKSSVDNFVKALHIFQGDRYNRIVNFWDDVYGFSMKCMKSDVLREAFVEIVPPEKLLTYSIILTEIDVQTCNVNACIFSSKFTLTSLKDGKLTAIAGYFDTFFDLETAVQFSTGPHAARTHWQQTLFYLPNTIDMKKGDTIEGTVSCTRLTKNIRGLSVTIKIGENKYQYSLD